MFVTGAHKINNKTKKYARIVGECLAKNSSVVLNSGQSEGVGSAALSSFMEYVLSHKQDINSRMHFFPNPYAVSSAYGKDTSLISALKQVRSPLIADSSFVILFAGGFGTKAEAELACGKNRLILPIVINDSDYNTEAISYILSNDKNNAKLKKKNPSYYKKLKKKQIFSKKDIVKIIEEIINEKV